ncbi:uncharacterized protein LOC103311768, partial [Acyrthosiphon pisum]|uniref:HAT C-terminal dimerisation domain-containing protein n=1 Tax=Acyrthosiphon pisum TaxID=7029 RepID=A0A8R2BB57_ACYPI
FKSIDIKVKQFIENHKDEHFTPLPQKRSRKRKMMPGEQAIDEPTSEISDPLTNFKYHTFYVVLDIICKKTICLPKYLHKDNKTYSDSESHNSDSESDEELILKDHIEDFTNSNSLIYIFKLFCSSNIRFTLPNIYMLVKIAVTIPVSSAYTERSFSKLKLVKTRLRSTMAESRLEGLIRIDCEHLYSN